MDLTSIKTQLSKEKDVIMNDLTDLETDAQREIYDTYVAGEILLMFIEGKAASDEQIIFLKKQSIDFTKVLALIGLQIIPGSSAALVLLEKVGEKYGIEIIPKPLSAPDAGTS